MITKSFCQHCAGGIEFESDNLTEENCLVPCPHCGLQTKLARDDYAAVVRSEPATEKQKAKLGWFGCTWEGAITKGQASDAIDECVRNFPELDRAYYHRPATPDQLERLQPYLAANGETPEDYAEEGKPFTYGQAKDLLEVMRLEERQKQEARFEREIEKRWTGREHDDVTGQPWFTQSDPPPVVESKARAVLEAHGISNVAVLVARAYGNMVINLDGDTDKHLAQAAEVLGIKQSDCI